MNDPGSFEVIGEPTDDEKRRNVEVIGTVELPGEIVDTKCYLGAMRPGVGKVHRACAARCLSGGIPPGLLVRDKAGGAFVFMLAGADGEEFGIDPQLAAAYVKIRGVAELHDGIPVLRVMDITRLAGEDIQ
jgi:hypothetical protein